MNLSGQLKYGLSIYFYVYAQRDLGAAKTSAYYAVAPFIGALLIIFREIPGVLFFIALVIMIAGTCLVNKNRSCNQEEKVQPDDSSCAITICVDARLSNVLVGERKHPRRYARMQGQAFISVPPISVNTIVLSLPTVTYSTRLPQSASSNSETALGSFSSSVINCSNSRLWMPR